MGLCNLQQHQSPTDSNRNPPPEWGVVDKTRPAALLWLLHYQSSRWEKPNVRYLPEYKTTKKNWLWKSVPNKTFQPVIYLKNQAILHLMLVAIYGYKIKRCIYKILCFLNTPLHTKLQVTTADIFYIHIFQKRFLHFKLQFYLGPCWAWSEKLFVAPTAVSPMCSSTRTVRADTKNWCRTHKTLNFMITSLYLLKICRSILWP